MGDWRGFRGFCLAAVAALLVALAAASSAGASGAASTFTVTGYGDGPGSCAAVDANGNVSCTTLRAAVNRASLQGNSPTIYLEPGTYQLTPGNGGQLDLASSMNIAGAGPGGSSGTTIEQTDGQNRVLEVNGTSTLSGLEITGGHYAPPWSSGQTPEGGGILVLGVLHLENSLVTSNQVVGAAGPASGDAGNPAQGGGIAYGSSAPSGSTISDSTISDNTANGGAGGPGGQNGGDADGGGIAYQASGPLSVVNSTVSGNAATGGPGGGGSTAGGSGGSTQGGGIYTSSGLTMTASTIAGNTAAGGNQGAGPPSSSHSGGGAAGGGIFSQESSSASTDQVVNSTVFGNSAAGGTASPGGTSGVGSAGGLSDGGPLDLESDTLDANQASYLPGNLDASATLFEPLDVQNTIIAGGSPDNCYLNGGSPNSTRAYDLEDDSADTCGFGPGGAASHGLVGVNPELPPSLGNYGGPTATLAPAPGSPALGAGGDCQATDQRGEPRRTPCDIGAFEAQPPSNASRPAVYGQVTRGQTLVCSQGTWTGDGPLSYAVTWLRNGDPIAGAGTNTYVVRAADAGQSLACQVTATYYGSSTAASPFVIVPSLPVITVLQTSVRGGVMVVTLGCRGTVGQRCLGRINLSVAERLRGRKVIAVLSAKGRTVNLAEHTYSILARRTATIRVPLGRNAAQLLQRFPRLTARLVVTQRTAIGTATVLTRQLRIRGLPRPH